MLQVTHNALTSGTQFTACLGGDGLRSMMENTYCIFYSVESFYVSISKFCQALKEEMKYAISITAI